MKYVLFFAIFTIQFGCAAKYAPPASSTTYIEFHMNPSLGINSNQFYFIYSIASCANETGKGIAANMAKIMGGGRKIKTVAVEANRQIYIGSHSKNHTPGVMATITRSCSNFLSFVPEKNKTYILEQQTIDDGCKTSVKDKALPESPVSFTEYDVPEDCSFWNHP